MEILDVFKVSVLVFLTIFVAKASNNFSTFKKKNKKTDNYDSEIEIFN